MKNNFGDQRVIIKNVLEEIKKLDLLNEERGLSMAECDRRRELYAEFWKLARVNESIFFQKSRSRWVREGDSNTRYFYAVKIREGSLML